MGPALSAHATSPTDDSGRNRPGSFVGQPLAWGANGNLVRKGPDHFAWGYCNRLKRVTRDGVGEIARYEYDAFNRLTKRVVSGETKEWVWPGWWLLERYENGQLAMQRVYGQGLDEVVRQEVDGNGDGVLETVTIPVYDSIGNAVAITDTNGKAIERYEYAPYGTRTIRVDLTPPAVEQLREADGTLLLELSEEILLQRVQEAIASGNLTLRDTTDDAPVAITASQPVRDGKQKGRRLLLTPDPGHPPQANHGMLLHIEPGAMVDLFENRPETAYERPFVWLDADHTIDDTTAPRVDLVITKAGELEVGFSEEIDPQVASAVILLDGQARAWTALPDRYTLKPAGALSATTHTLQIGPALIDQAGNPMTEPFTRNITTGATDQIAYERPDPRVTPTSTLDNLASFQGHITDPATGLVYMRNRWMDPEMGRFLSDDPNLYMDSSNPGQFGLASPTNLIDPLGEEVLGYASSRAWGCRDYDVKDKFGGPSDMSFVERAGDRLLIMVHGYNVDEESAAATFWQVNEGFRAAGSEQPIEGFTWAGDPLGETASVPFFPWAELNANCSGVTLAGFLQDIRHRGGSGQDLFVMTHSLGARVALGALSRLAAYNKSSTSAGAGGVEIDGLFLFNAAVPSSSVAGYGAFSDAFDAVDDVFNYYSAGDPVLGGVFPANEYFMPFNWSELLLNRLGPGLAHPALGTRSMKGVVAAKYAHQVADRDMMDRSIAGVPATTHSDHLNPGAWTNASLQAQLYLNLAADLNRAHRASRPR